MNGESWLMNPDTRDYEQEGGKPVVTRSLKMPMYFRTLAPRNRWLYAPDDRWGSDFYQFHTKLTADAAALAQATERRALQPIIEDGRAVDIEVSATAEGRSGVVINAKSIEANGNESELTGLRPIRS